MYTIRVSTVEQQTAPELIRKIRNDWLKPPPSLDFNQTNVASAGSYKVPHQIRMLSQLVQRLVRNQVGFSLVFMVILFGSCIWFLSISVMHYF